MKVALVGQPNCGKSTLFNSVAGYRSATGNFPGTTVQLTWSKVRLNGSVIDLADLPGTYSLSASSQAEQLASRFLLDADVGVIVNVLDASLLSRSLELTLELRELGLPMVVCLNMMDEARHKGISISAERLSQLLELPVVCTVASRGEGVRELFARVAQQAGKIPPPAPALAWHRDVEEPLRIMQSHLETSAPLQARPARFRAVKLVEGDADFLSGASADTRALALEIAESLRISHGRPAESVIMSERHDRSMHLFEQAATVGRPQPDIRLALDNLLMHSFWGYPLLLGILVGFFWAVFGVGSLLETALLGHLNPWFDRLTAGLTPGTLAFALARSVWDGFTGGIGIVLPYLVPFLIGLAILEDLGYLPRVAYLMDGLLHRVGLHGTSMLPLILGYGCSVPACLATRILPSRRDRFLASVLSILVPCSARSVVIFALVAFYLGPGWALGIYALDALVVLLSGWALTRIWPEVSAGMVLEVPNYHWPTPRAVVLKVWLRLREFVIIAWPLLVGGSVLLGVMEHYGWDRLFNAAWAPLGSLLGLPAAVGTILIFGTLRKELTLIMLVQVLGTTRLASVMTTAQLLVFTVFVTFYFPCLATLGVLIKEIGAKLTALAAAYTFVLAMALSLAVRFLFAVT
jgi:ferrous iron transport protein B